MNDLSNLSMSMDDLTNLMRRGNNLITIKDKKSIVKIARKYDFYPNEIKIKVNKGRSICDIDAIVDKDCGFMVWEDLTNPFTKGSCCLLAFAFVIPSMRRKGVMTMYLDCLKTKFHTITLTTSNPAMIAFCYKNGFKNYGKAMTNVEDCFAWSKVMTDEEIRTIYYPTLTPPTKKKRKGRRGGKKKRGGRRRKTKKVVEDKELLTTMMYIENSPTYELFLECLNISKNSSLYNKYKDEAVYKKFYNDVYLKYKKDKGGFLLDYISSKLNKQ